MKLELTARKNIWSISPLHWTEKDDEVQELRKKVLKRDEYTCQCCGWKSRYFQEVHHKDHNHKNNNLNNLVTVCPLCHQVFHLPTVSLLKSGTMIWLPEMSQEALNNFCLHLFLAEEVPELKNIARSIFSELEQKKEFLNIKIGRENNASDVNYFSQALLELQNEKEAIENINKNIRLLPYKDRFSTQIDYWVKERKVFDKEKNFFKQAEMMARKYGQKFHEQLVEKEKTF